MHSTETCHALCYFMSFYLTLCVFVFLELYTEVRMIYRVINRPSSCVSKPLHIVIWNQTINFSFKLVTNSRHSNENNMAEII